MSSSGVSQRCRLSLRAPGSTRWTGRSRGSETPSLTKNSLISLYRWDTSSAVRTTDSAQFRHSALDEAVKPRGWARAPGDEDSASTTWGSALDSRRLQAKHLRVPSLWWERQNFWFQKGVTAYSITPEALGSIFSWHTQHSGECIWWKQLVW